MHPLPCRACVRAFALDIERCFVTLASAVLLLFRPPRPTSHAPMAPGDPRPKKYEIEKALHEEHKAIQSGQLKEDSPLDDSEGFRQLCEACRRGDLAVCQSRIQEGTNINARDRFDYTPLILVSALG